VFADDWFFDDDCSDCADEGTVLDGPASLLRALIDVEPSPPIFTSALWRGLADVGSLDHRADTLDGLPPQAS
jgi:hypothetical protein